MIPGVSVKAVGLTWAVAGLKHFHYETYIPDPPHIHLTKSHLESFNFFRLASDIHERGFTTAQEVFDWVATSRILNPHRLLRSMQSLKFKGERKMCNEFLNCLGSLIAPGEPKKCSDVQAIQDQALSLFGKRKEFDDTARMKYLFREVKMVFGGNLVKSGQVLCIGGSEDCCRRDEGSHSRWDGRQGWGSVGGALGY